MLSPSHSRCIAACQEAIAACDGCLARVDPAVTDDAEGRHCADLCRSAIRLCGLVVDELALHSVFSIQVCALCAVICRACAEECETRPDEPAWRACAAAALCAAAECHAIATCPKARSIMPDPVVTVRSRPGIS